MNTLPYARITTPILTLLSVLLMILSAALVTHAQQTNITGPAGTAAFGVQVVTLPNGNFVVTDPFYNEGAVPTVGAVFLYDGATLALISKLTGSTLGDNVGSGPIVVLTGGNHFVVRSDRWNNLSGTLDVGAVTLCSTTVGCNGMVSPANSLIGSTANDRVGDNGITALPNGNYVVRSFDWNNGAASRAGAVTFCNAATNSCANQVVSASNSLIGSTTNDVVGGLDLTILTNGNFLVNTPTWDNTGVIPTASNAGAVTFCSGTTGCSGILNGSNSLVGTTTGESNSRTLTALSNSNYVVGSPEWDNGATLSVGAVTWCSGASGCTGAISAANSLIGTTASDFIGGSGVTALSNGNYVVNSPFWDNGAAANVGAITFCIGTSGCTGTVSALNSLVGSTSNSPVGINLTEGVTALTNGNYVVRSPLWDGVTFDVGAVTWCSGTSGCTGAVTAANSLTGTLGDSEVGGGPTLALANGNYVVNSPSWDGATGNIGAATLCNGATNSCAGVAVSAANSLTGASSNDLLGSVMSAFPNGNYVVRSINWDGAASNVGAITFCDSTTNSCAGQAVSASNSLVGSMANDGIGDSTVTTLTNGNLVIHSSIWDNTSANVNAGAFTFCHSTTGCSTGVLSSANSLTGTRAGDLNNGVIAFTSLAVIALTNGNYLIQSPNWSNGAATNAGAVTWCDGVTGCTGEVSAATSLIGSTANDRVGTATALSNGNYTVFSTLWDNPPLANAGFALYGDGANGTFGTPSAPTNSDRTVIGTESNGITQSQIRFDAVNNQMIVGRSNSNLVTVLKLPTTTPTDATPPVISPNVSGTLGNDDWYRSDITISWSITDAESTVSAQTGCDTQIVISDTSGVTFTCTATSSGGTDSQSVTVKRDTTSPFISPISRTEANSNGWNNSDVTVQWSCSDATSGAINSVHSQTASLEGENQSLTGTCQDNAGNIAIDTQAGISIDMTGPHISFVSRTPAANVNGWNNTNVTVNWNCSDGISGIVNPGDSQTVSTEGPNQSSTGTCVDNAGNIASDTQTGISIDTTAPILSPTVTPNPVFLNGTATATANATDTLSGIATQSCAATNTATVGSKTVACTATDIAGNTAGADASYEVVSNLYNFGGFFQPVDNLPMVNIATAGSAISVKFSLSGNQGLNIMAAGYPASSPVACNANEPGAVIEETVNAGGSSLTYDASTDRYSYVWKTNKAWKGTCRIFVMRLIDGSDHFAKFNFK